MSKIRLLSALIAGLSLLIIFGIGAAADQNVPAPYAGLKNSFPWDDTNAQQAGKKLYQQSCIGCHGAKGDGVAISAFDAAYSAQMEKTPDLSFWMLSEGRLDKGMPPFKAILSNEQRWQTLTYIWSLPRQAPPVPSQSPAPTAETPAVKITRVLRLSAPTAATAGQKFILAAYVRDDKGNPIANAPVRFAFKVSFFGQGVIDIGEAMTDNQGTAKIETFLRRTGDVQIIARSETLESVATMTLTGNQAFYFTSVGIKMPSLGTEVLVGPIISESVDIGHAPASILRLPGGTLSWLLLLVVAVLGIWSTYFFVVYQIVGITASAPKKSNIRLYPYAALAVVALIGLLMALKLIISP